MEELHLSNTAVHEIGHLSKMKQLRILGLHNTGVNDLGPIFELSNLQYLRLGGCDIAQEQIDHLMKVLPNCELQK